MVMAYEVDLLQEDRDPDKGVPREVLVEHVKLALAARYASPWASSVPWSIFLNDVLPYASLDEPRDDAAIWRPLLAPIAEVGRLPRFLRCFIARRLGSLVRLFVWQGRVCHTTSVPLSLSCQHLAEWLDGLVVL
jgi:hypothetical protein